MKYDYRRQEKELYTVAPRPGYLDLPAHPFIMIRGTGDPNKPAFAERLNVLYSLAYTIKMSFKARCSTQPDLAEASPYHDFTVYPLEGWWSMVGDDPTDKDNFVYTIMIRQPEVITDQMVAEAQDSVLAKKSMPLVRETSFETMTDGPSIHMLHVGPFDDEPRSFALMEGFAAAQGYERSGHEHREIYLSDTRKVAPERYRTILSFPVRPASPGV
jgi:hypothetical protein